MAGFTVFISVGLDELEVVDGFIFGASFNSSYEHGRLPSSKILQVYYRKLRLSRE